MDDDLSPEGMLWKVTLEIRQPCAATDEQVEEWLKYELGHSGSCMVDNPLLDHSVETFGAFGFDLECLMVTGSEERTLISDDGTTKRFSVRHIRKRVA